MVAETSSASQSRSQTQRRSFSTAASRVLGTVVIAAAVSAMPAIAATPRHRRAHRSSHLTYVRETAHLTPSAHSSLRLVEHGTGHGTFTAPVQIVLSIKSRVTGTFTAQLHGGSITGYTSAKPHINGRYASFKGTLKLTGGTGRYRHASGTAGFYGSIDRYNYHLNVQVIGHLHL